MGGFAIDSPKKMKLLGVEFANFACLDRQFIPLRPGINLLVGKNNAGKTALLRGLSALGSLPVGNVQPIPAELAGYCRDSSSTFTIELLYRTEQSDAQFFYHPEVTAGNAGFQEMVRKLLLQELEGEGALARWRFKVFGANRLVGFLDLTIELPDRGARKERQSYSQEMRQEGFCSAACDTLISWPMPLHS
jgi:hypothetical protein